MCIDCGCETANKLSQTTRHSGIGITSAPSPMKPTQKISLEHMVLAKNNLIANSNRQWFLNNQVRVLNMISSPGAGKTLLLEKTIERLPENFKMSILTGDQEEDFDAQRLTRRGAHVKQINTISSCHLDASMLAKELLGGFVSPQLDLLVIENVGNLVCPAAFDLGENDKVALISTTEGEDKPSKYPLLFHEASVIVITKMDLVPHLDWQYDLCLEHIRRVNARAQIIPLSSKTEEGMDTWINYLTEKLKKETLKGAL